MQYIKQLDSIRAFAVILVIISHWFPYHYVKILRFGNVGVEFFFVLSGFLITRILLNSREKSETFGKNKVEILKNFIARRSLRIFPIYYILLVFLFIFAKSTTNIENDLFYYVSYTSNWLFFVNNSFDGMLSHLWSLGVEEQFYLIWPWVIIFVNKKYILPAIFIFLGVGVLSGITLPYFLPQYKVRLATTSCFDAFSLGAIFSYYLVYKDTITSFFIKYLKYFAIVAGILFLVKVLLNYNVILPERTLTSMVALYLIVWAVTHTDNFFSEKILSNKFLIFIGKISYGIYLYHNIIPWLWGNLSHKVNFLEAINSAAIKYNFIHLLLFILLIIISYTSWLFIENPINKLKNNFE